MKKVSSISVVFLLILCMLCAPCGALVTEADPPRTAEEAALLWSYVPGTGYRDAPSVPAPFAGKVYVMHNKTLDCLDAATGKVERSGSMTAAPSYAIVPVCCTDDAVYCPLEGGTVQAFARDTLSSRWVYADPLGGQALSPIVRDGECLYTGFWNDENEDAAFVCLDARTGECRWRLVQTGGFYCTSCLVQGAYVLLGGDDGSVKTGTGTFRCLDRMTGETLDTLSYSGDHRSAILSYADALWFVTKAGVLYKVRMQAGSLTLCGSVRLPGAATAAPIGYDGKLYLGVQDGRAGALMTLDASSTEVLGKTDLPGYPQAELLLSTAGTARLYATCNTPPGSIYVIDAQSSAVQTLYEPPQGLQGYCISPVQVMPDGTLLYKNDSGAIFAVGKKAVRQTFLQRLIERLRAFWNKLISWFSGGKQ
ncbi:MAG: PQQ-binding-like beta-propeller repeat protein [Clostridia bacterium]|nr:PQQ-binding-like beta-propeller repeat protein [Clostridia bacterium]